jgi:hypothetical protein
MVDGWRWEGGFGTVCSRPALHSQRSITRTRSIFRNGTSAKARVNDRSSDQASPPCSPWYPKRLALLSSAVMQISDTQGVRRGRLTYIARSALASRTSSSFRNRTRQSSIFDGRNRQIPGLSDLKTMNHEPRTMNYSLR